MEAYPVKFRYFGVPVWERHGRRCVEILKWIEKRQTWVIYAYSYKYALFTQAVGQLGMAMKGLGRNDCVPTVTRRPATNISYNKKAIIGVLRGNSDASLSVSVPCKREFLQHRGTIYLLRGLPPQWVESIRRSIMRHAFKMNLLSYAARTTRRLLNMHHSVMVDEAYQRWQTAISFSLSL